MKKIILLLSIILSFIMIVGNSFYFRGNFSIITKYPFLTIILFFSILFLFYKIIDYLFNKLDHLKERENKKNIKLFDEHPFLFCFIIILIGWLIYIIAFYPVILSPDPSYQIMQYFGIDNKYSTYSVLLDESVIITNHHPVVHTLLLGSMLKIGTLLNNVNLGLFFYSMIQITILASVLSYTIVFMKKLKISNRYLMIVLAIYTLTPVFPFYSMSAVKDVIFGSLVILYILSLYHFTHINNIKYKEVILEIILMILMILFRNNGIHVILLTFPFLFVGSKNFKKYLFIFLIIITFHVSYNKVILPYFKITPSSIRETLSIPFQQTARYVKEHEEEVTEEEKKTIDKILTYDTLIERYNPELSDPVKNEFNRYATKEDLKNYFITWLKGLTKHPITYIEATIENTYGYFYPIKTNWYFYSNYDTRIVKKGFNYHFNDLKSIRKYLMVFATIFPYIPILGLLVNIGFNSWILLFMASYCIYKKNYKNLIVLLPSFVLLLICIASPANTYFRYALPNIFAMPLLIGLFLKKAEKNINLN